MTGPRKHLGNGKMGHDSLNHIETLQFEASKIDLRPSDAGDALTIRIHPDDIPQALYRHRPGTRYMVVMVPIEADEMPRMSREAIEGDRAVQAAGMLCRQAIFQGWMVRCGGAEHEGENEVIRAVRSYCGIDSRAELRHNEAAREKFKVLQYYFMKEEYSQQDAEYFKEPTNG